MLNLDKLNIFTIYNMVNLRNAFDRKMAQKPSLELYKRLKKYEENLINNISIEKGYFKDYQLLIDKVEITYNNVIMDNKVIEEAKKISSQEQLINYLKIVTNRKLSAIIVDYLFEDNIHNVHINIKEMLKFYDINKVLNSEQISLYKKILNIDNISIAEKINIYNIYKDKQLNKMFYMQLRKIRDLSYKKIFDNLTDIKTFPKIGNDVEIYDLRLKNYTLLVRCSNKIDFQSKERNNPYSLISDENNTVYNDEKNNKDNYSYIYGYSNIPIEHIMHVFEKDSNSINVYDDSLSASSACANRITTKDNLIRENGYNEINIINIKKDDYYETKKPDYIVAKDFISEYEIEESKRLKIPIVLINDNKKKNSDTMISKDDMYIFKTYMNEEITKNR